MVGWTLVLAACGPRVCSAAEAAPTILSFEADTLPQRLSWQGVCKVSVSDAHYIHGARSLKWAWQPGSALRIDGPIAYKAEKWGFPRDMFAVWLYNEVPRPGENVRITFYTGDEPNCHFDFQLNFTGWRPAWVPFQYDMEGEPGPAMNRVTIAAPQDGDPGVFYLDQVILSHRKDHRFREVPNVDRSQASQARGAIQDPEGELTADEQQWLQMLAGRVTAQMGVPATPATPAQVDELQNRYEAFNIVVDERGVRGNHLFPDNRYFGALPGSLTEGLLRRPHGFQYLTELMRDVGRAYLSGPSQDDRQRLAAMYTAMARHLLDQGYNDGGRGVWGYNSRAYFPAVFLMRDVLKQAGLLEEMSLAARWLIHADRVLGDMPPTAISMDYLNTEAFSHTVVLMSMPDTSAKVAALQRFSAWLSAHLAVNTPGNRGGIKPDGCTFHHWMHYSGYGLPGLRGAVRVIGLLDGTPCEISPAAYENVKRAVMMTRIWGHPAFGFNAVGRHPLGGTADYMKSSFLTLAQSRPGTDQPDSDLAAAYMRLWPPDSEGEAIELFGHPPRPEPQPEGHWTMNYAASGIHRHGGNMASIKGFNRYVRGTEIYTADNRYGRYQSYGTIQIFKPGGLKASGHCYDGWDWNRPPGATTVHLPWETLDGGGPRHTAGFSGSSNLDGKYGVFGFKLDPPDGEKVQAQALRMRKSVFSFGDMLVCLGSEIANPSAEHHTETTLFQNGLAVRDVPVWANSPRLVAQFPHRQELSVGSGVWLVDAVGMGYYVAGPDRVVLTRGEQESRHDKTRKPTKGDFATAWIDHGVAPTDAGYEYAIVLDATPARMAALAQAMRSPTTAAYEVLRRDDVAHILRHRQSSVSGAVFFEPCEDSHAGLVRSANRPCLVMYKPLADGLRLSMCDPDLNLTGELGAGVPTSVEVAIEGVWRLSSEVEGALVDTDGEQTTVTVTCRHGVPVALQLER